MISNSASVKGGATLFLTILTLVAAAGDRSVGRFDLADPADVDADAGVKFQCAAAGGGFRISEHDADFFADLVGEDAAGAGFRNEARQFAQGRAHQPRLRAHRGVADLAFEFLLCDERGHGVEHDDVDGIRTHELLADLQCFLAAARLGNQQFVHVHPEFLRILGVERVLDVDERGEAAPFLRLRDRRSG